MNNEGPSVPEPCVHVMATFSGSCWDLKRQTSGNSCLLILASQHDYYFNFLFKATSSFLSDCRLNASCLLLFAKRPQLCLHISPMIFQLLSLLYHEVAASKCLCFTSVSRENSEKIELCFKAMSVRSQKG